VTPSNFDWFLHTMLFYHTRDVVEKQENRRLKLEQEELEQEKDENENENEEQSDNEDQDDDSMEIVEGADD
jgi:hypothetical protein